MWYLLVMHRFFLLLQIAGVLSILWVDPHNPQPDQATYYFINPNKLLKVFLLAGPL
jgi:hypothetical protein